MSKLSLPNIEIATLGALPRGKERDKKIRNLQKSKPPFTYEPLRKSLSDILHTVGPLGLEMPPVPWATIEKIVLSRCTSRKGEKSYNVAKAKALFDFRELEDIRYSHYQMSSSLILPNDSRITFWSDMIAVVDGRPLLPFFDLRSTSGLISDRAKLIAMSIQSRVAIEQDADLAHNGVLPAIIQVAGSLEVGFTAKLIETCNLPFLSLKEIEDIVLELWDDMLRIAREDQDSQKGTGTGG